MNMNNKDLNDFEKQLNRNIYTKHDAGAIFLASVSVPQIFGVFFLICLMVISSLTKTQYSILAEHPATLIILSSLSQICFMAIFFVYNYLGRFNAKNACKINFKFGFGSLIISIIIGLIALFGFNNIITCFDQLLKLLGHTSASMPLPLNTPVWLFVNIILLCVFPAVCEELLFRGMILNGLKQYGKLTAIFASAGLFALLHGNIDQLIYPFIFGIILALIACFTDSVIPTIIVHFVNNCVVVVINYINNINSTAADINFNWLFVLLSIVYAYIACIIIALLMFALWKIKKKRELKKQNVNNLSEEEINYYLESKKSPNKLLWIGICVGALIWILSLFS